MTMTRSGPAGRPVRCGGGSHRSQNGCSESPGDFAPCDGDLDKVGKIFKLVGYVASADGFVQQPDVINAASEIFVELWGEAGVHARTAIGVAQLPLGVSAEIELVVELEVSR